MLSEREGRRVNAIAEMKAHARRAYPLLWRAFIDDWKTDGPDATWLMYSANYLFRTAGLRWAMDPYALSARLPGLDPPDYAADLAGLSLVALTHAHVDHLDLGLIAALSRQASLQWVIPAHILPFVRERIDLPSSRIIVPQNGVPVVVGGVSLTPFDGLHRRGTHGIDETGYLVEFEGQRWLFPGDTRQYDLSLLPSFGRLDGCFAHLWLGRSCAAMEYPPLLDEFCDFYRGLNPRTLVVTHLAELGRNEFELWDERHYRMIEKRLARYFSNGNIFSASMGDRVNFEMRIS